MHSPSKNRCRFPITLMSLFITAIMLADVAAAPPPWAPAHGYRAKQEHRHYGHSHDHYYGVMEGRCNREAIGAVVGGTAGGIIGHEVDDGGVVGTAAGAVIGVIIGSIIGRSMDEADRRCAGNAFEYAPDRQPVRWHDPRYDRDYVLTPYNTRQIDGRYCRDYVMETVLDDGRLEEIHGRACRQGNGEWRIVSGQG